MPWRGLPQRHVERGGVAVVAIGSTGSCGVGGWDVSEVLKVFDLDVRNAHPLFEEMDLCLRRLVSCFSQVSECFFGR